MSLPCAPKEKLNVRRDSATVVAPSRAGVATIVSEPEEKIYRFSFHKRRRLDNFDSVPFGYITGEQCVSTSQCVT
jgi:hypothetical protein